MAKFAHYSHPISRELVRGLYHARASNLYGPFTGSPSMILPKSAKLFSR